MGLFDTNKLTKLLKIEKEHTPYIVIAMGRIGDYSKIEDLYLKKDTHERYKKTDIAKKI